MSDIPENISERAFTDYITQHKDEQAKRMRAEKIWDSYNPEKKATERERIRKHTLQIGRGHCDFDFWSDETWARHIDAVAIKEIMAGMNDEFAGTDKMRGK